MDICLIYGRLVTLTTLLGERCTYSEAGPEGLQGLEWWYVQLGRTLDSGLYMCALAVALA